MYMCVDIGKAYFLISNLHDSCWLDFLKNMLWFVSFVIDVDQENIRTGWVFVSATWWQHLSSKSKTWKKTYFWLPYFVYIQVDHYRQSGRFHFTCFLVLFVWRQPDNTWHKEMSISLGKLSRNRPTLLQYHAKLNLVDIVFDPQSFVMCMHVAPVYSIWMKPKHHPPPKTTTTWPMTAFHSRSETPNTLSILETRMDEMQETMRSMSPVESTGKSWQKKVVATLSFLAIGGNICNYDSWTSILSC